jgi:hypothetical protein
MLRKQVTALARDLGKSVEQRRELERQLQQQQQQ